MINYYLLTKPGIVLGNLITVAAGFFLASKGDINPLLFVETLFGLALIMASACVFNNYIDRHLDKKMERTKNRPFVKGLVSAGNALLFASLIGILGGIVLLRFTNFITFVVAATGFFVYVVLYSLWKGHTIYGTAIGSIAGAVPPVVGYCAVRNNFDEGAIILFAMMVLWQMPHFFSIALHHLDDYAKANIPVLPVKKGPLRTKIHMVIYILAFICSALLLPALHYTGFQFLVVTVAMGFAWLVLCIQGFFIKNHKRWGRQMFYFSLILISVISLSISLDSL